MEVTVSFPLAFLAGLVSFLSPCVLPVVPGYLTYVTGMTLDELAEGSASQARRLAVVHTVLFGLGFGLVFMSLGAAASLAGQRLAAWLPAITRAGGVVVALFGLHLLGWLKIPFLGRERRITLASRPAGWIGSLAVGVAFGAGWTPCIGPVLASILLFAGLDTTVLHGTALLAVYGLGLAVPFVVAAIGFNFFLAGSARVRRWLPWIERGAGAVLLVLGIFMATGRFAMLTAYLADLGQLVTLE